MVNESYKRVKVYRCGVRDFKGEVFGRVKNIDILIGK